MLGTPVSSVGVVTYGEDRPTFHKFSWIEGSELSPFCVSHLKEYGNTLQLLELARKYSEDAGTKNMTTLTDYSAYVEEKLKSFKALSPKDKWEGATGYPYYVKPIVKYIVFNDVMLTKEGRRASFIRVEKGNPSNLTSNGQYFGAGDEEALEQLEKLVHAFEADDKVVGYVNDFLKVSAEHAKNTYAEEFEIRKNQVVRELTLGQRELKGHCDLCP